MNSDSTFTYEPTPDKVPFTTNGWKWKPTGPLPTRDPDGTLRFEDFPDFTPNKTPEEIIREGAFGGGYFWPFRSQKLNLVGEAPNEEWVELPPEWFHGLDKQVFLTGEKHNGYEALINKFKVSCEQSVDEWLAAGWFQWYSRFFQGRRIPDDRRQINKWTRRVGTEGIWRNMLLQDYERQQGKDIDTERHDPLLQQTCHHWAHELRQHELDTFWLSRLVSERGQEELDGSARLLKGIASPAVLTRRNSA